MPRMKVRPAGYYDPENPIRPWPEVLIGLDEISRFLRVHVNTAKTMLSSGDVPAAKDKRGRWTTTQSAINSWILRKHFDEIASRRKGPDRIKRVRRGGKT